MNIKNFLQEVRYYVKLEGFKRPFLKFLWYQSPLKKLVNTLLYNKIYLKVIKRKAGEIQPQILQIETTNACNAKCLMCPHRVMKRGVCTMSLEDFKKVLDNVMKNYPLIKRLTINGFGEPLVDRGIIEKIDYVNQKYPKLKVDIYTNASALTRDIADKLLEKKLGRVTFSINGYEKEDYEKIMGLNFENVRKNVLYFLKRKKELGKKFLVNASMMILKENKGKAEGFVDFWRPRVDSVRTYFPSDWAGELKENLGEQKIPFDRKQWPCSASWTHIVIHSRGEFLACCRDFNSAWDFGNILKGDDIKKMREGKKFKEMQRQHLNFDFSFPLCRNCDHAYDSSIEWWLW